MPKSYDEITRGTVPDPDTSVRPSKKQVEDAYSGDFTKGHDELQLYAAVQGALHTHAEGSNVAIEIRDDRVELRGSVAKAASMDEIEALVRSVPGVGSVSNKLVVSH
ncbi:MAG TPA: BON domain-containing protein [Kofleriaceae bacterium]|jgi:osmotically-inducible protein OsmY